MEDARGRPEVLARAQTYVIEKQSRQDASELRLRAKPARKGAGRASSSDVQFGSLEEGDGPDHRFQGRSQAYVRKNKDAHQDLLQQFDKALKFRIRNAKLDAQDDDADASKGGGFKMGSLKLSVSTRAVVHPGRPHSYVIHVPQYNRPRSLAIELKTPSETVVMDMYIVLGTQKSPGPSCFDWRGTSGCPLVIEPSKELQSKASDYTLAVYVNRAVSYSILCDTLGYFDPSSSRNADIARNALRQSLQARMFDSDIKRLQSKHYKTVVSRPQSAPLSRDASEGFVGILDPGEGNLLKVVIGDEKEVEILKASWRTAKSFTMSSRADFNLLQFVSVSDWDFNPDKLRGDITKLLGSISKAGSAKSQEALSQLDVLSIASKLASAVLEEKIQPPSAKILSAPIRESAVNLMSLQERADKQMKERMIISAKPSKAVANNANILHKQAAQGISRSPAKAGGAVGGSWMDRKLAMIQNLGGLPSSQLMMLSSNATDYRTYSWEAALCRLDKAGSLWVEPIPANGGDSAQNQGISLWEGLPQVLCKLHDLQTVAESQLEDQPSFLYCFQLVFQTGPLIFAALSADERSSWVRIAQLFEPAEISLLLEAESKDACLRKFRSTMPQMPAPVVATKRPVKAADTGDLHHGADTGDSHHGAVKAADTGNSHHGAEHVWKQPLGGSFRGRPRPSSALAGATSLPLDSLRPLDSQGANRALPTVRPASAMAGSAGAVVPSPMAQSAIASRVGTRPSSAMAAVR